MADLAIRPAGASDHSKLLQLVKDLQEFERTLHASRRSGAEVAEAYVAQLAESTERNQGRILVAEENGEMLGFVCCWVAEEDDVLLTDEAKHYGYISDVFVVSGRRREGIGGQLIAAAEAHLDGLGLTRILVCSLAANGDARAVYERLGYTAYEVVYEKQRGNRGA